MIEVTDSYEDLTTLDNLMSNNVYTEPTWSGLTDTEKKRYVDTAMKIIDDNEWIGNKSDANHQLQFPRNFDEEIMVARESGNQFRFKRLFNWNDEIFDELKVAQRAIMIDLIAFDTSSFDAVSKAGVKEFTAGRNAIGFKFGDIEYNPLLAERALRLIGWLLADSDSNKPIRTGRA